MKFLKRAVKVLAVVVTLFIVTGLVLPDRAHVERAVVIDAPPSKIFALINDFREFNKRSPWFARDRDIEVVLVGPRSGVGARMSWRSNHPEVGTGSQEIIASEPDSLVHTRLDVGQQGTATAEFRRTPQGDATRVTWDLRNSSTVPSSVATSLMFDRMIGPDYETGLASLKSLGEAHD